MKILLINERYSEGGTEVQSLRELKLLSQLGIETYYLTFDNKYPDQKCLGDVGENWINLPIDYGDIQKFFGWVWGDRRYHQIIKNIINDISPDFIHINNIFSVPVDVYELVQPYFTLQTIRDYAAVCPKGTCIDGYKNICAGYLCSNCLRCFKLSVRDALKYFLIKRINKLRISSINYFVAPSRALAETCTNNGIPTEVLNNPFDFSILKKDSPNVESNIYMYYGKISQLKGVSELIEAFEIFHSHYKEKKLWIIGEIEHSYKKTFYNLLNPENADYIIYKGAMKNSEIMNIYKDIYCVVVPSLWVENYPNTVLEALASKTLVIGTNRGGIPELIQNDNLLFNIISKSDIVSKLDYTAQIPPEEYISIVEEGYSRVLKMNNTELYKTKLIEIMNLAKTSNDKT